MYIEPHWTEVKELYADGTMIVIVGMYNHRSKMPKGYPTLGLYYPTFPKTEGLHAPLVVEDETARAILNAKLLSCAQKGDLDTLQRVNEGRKFLGFMD